MSTVAEQAIESKTGVCGGSPVIRGTRITVKHIVLEQELSGKSPAEIAADYQLTLAQVYDALAWYFHHKEEVDRDIAADNGRLRDAADALGIVISG